MTEQAVVFAGSDTNIFRAMAVSRALRFYAKTGMKVNSMYTPRNMMGAATQVTGKKFKARDYVGAADALTEWVKNNKKADV